ncbi:BgTH12-01952 [Blumeria graminis f. sp. triticale]|uniref:Bgt-4110 n=3 Tax=Blumeria graminis TaxID=34373 RepID=A0A381LHN9_BLUGR|nr:hypothetical protein BGT96224_4110 [Blumeria graminis f. sp. tritici 96224]CAD6501702.1 BgTH12-01952 [Blumeria graminis f. sp. triticale]VDB84338.1 Bgt-4110 [Blumeria graminis f. sp. tritici]
MDLLSTIRKEGSRGGVEFSWSDVTTSQHRENYLGHSVMAPVGRWQKGKDLTWYAKGSSISSAGDQTVEERNLRERKEEIRKIKEAEEDALAKALGLPVKQRNTSESNAITLSEVNQAVKDAGVGEDNGVDTGKSFGDFPSKTQVTQRGSEVTQEILEKNSTWRSNHRKEDHREHCKETKHRHHRHHHHHGHRQRSLSPDYKEHKSRSRGILCKNYRAEKKVDQRVERSDVFRNLRRERHCSADRHRIRDHREHRARSRRTKSPDFHSNNNRRG